MFEVSSTDAAHVDIPAGYVLNGQYEVVEEVGRGLAVVYRADFLGRDIALKIVPAEPSTGIDPLEQLAQEWERQNGINSEQVVRAYPPQRAQYEGLPLLVLPMEYAPEGSFRRWLNDHYEDREDRVSLGLELFLQACHGVVAIHRAGQVHLDLKPENILLFKAGAKLTAKVADFGIARSLRHVSGKASSPFSCCGTPEYMAPEQFSFPSEHPIGVQSDIYSLGVMLFELVAGHRPFDSSEHLELKNMHLHRDRPRLTSELSRWDKVIDRCMRKVPEKRYGCVEDLIREVNHIKREFSLTVDVACPICDHMNIDATQTDCEQCDTPLPDSFFRMCTRCNGKVRLDQEDCPRCRKQGIAAYYLLQERMARAEKLKDEDPIEAIELLELVLREGAGDSEKRAAEILVDLRQKHDRVIPLCSEAAQALAGGDIEKAIKAWQDVSAIIPRHRQALRNTKELKKQLGELIERKEKALSLVEEARFDTAESLLVSCLEAVPTRRDIREALDLCRKRAREYSEVFSQAEEAYRCQMISRAKEFVHQALQCAPRSREAARIAKEIAKIERQTEDLIQRACHQMSSGGLGEVHRAVAEIERLWADCPELARLERDLAEIEQRYDSAMKEAEEALAIRDLTKAGRELTQALEACPRSVDVKSLLGQVEEDNRCAKEILGKVPSAMGASQFAQAEALIHDSEKLWSSHPELERVQKELVEIRNRFSGLMSRAHKAFDARALDEASRELEHAVEVCPDAVRARALLDQVEEHKRHAGEVLAAASSAVRASKFGRAEDLIRDSEEIWSSNPGLEYARRSLSATQNRFGSVMGNAQEAMTATG